MHLITLSGLMLDTALSLRSSLQSTNTIQVRRRRQHPITVHTDAQGWRDQDHVQAQGQLCQPARIANEVDKQRRVQRQTTLRVSSEQLNLDLRR